MCGHRNECGERNLKWKVCVLNYLNMRKCACANLPARYFVMTGHGGRSASAPYEEDKHGEPEEKQPPDTTHVSFESTYNLAHMETPAVADRDTSSAKNSTLGDAHTWWAYVWHELRNCPDLGVMSCIDDGEEPTALNDRSSDNDINKLRVLIRSQAIELTSLRQVPDNCILYDCLALI